MINARKLFFRGSSGIWRGVKFLWRGLWNAHVPLIWNIAVVLLAAVGTYFLSPALTEKFERQKIRSGYISSNLEDMNVLVSDFYVAVMKATSATGSQRAAEFQKVDELAARLSWKSIEIGAVLQNDDDRALMARFTRNLQAVQRSAVKTDTEDGQKAFRANLKAFSITSVLVIQGVAQRAELSNDRPIAEVSGKN